MKPRQYKPYSYQLRNIPLIIYPVKDESPLTDIFDSIQSINQHVKELYEKNWDNLNKGDYHILFVWNLENHKMVDIWIHSMENWSDSGPFVECLTYKDLETCHDAGIASGDSLIALGREEELRRKIDKLEDYYNRDKYLPEFPEGLQPTESFSVSEQ